VTEPAAARAIPIIRLHGIVLVSIQTALSDRLILDLKDDVAQEIRNSEADGLVIEVSGIDLFDSFIARSIQEIAKMARLMGVKTVLAGLNAGMAITLVEMGMALEGVVTALNLEAALDRLGVSLSRREGSSTRVRPSDADELLDAGFTRDASVRPR
jgi:rsbT antagonist protein RsbS